MTSLRPLPLLLLAVLGGCVEPARTTRDKPGPAAAAPATPAAPSATALRPAEPSPAKPEVGSLAGAWRVAGIDGAALNEPTGLALTGDERQLWWEPRCAGAARAYRIQGSRVSFTSAQGRRATGGPTPPVCAIGLPPRLGDVMRALDEATSVTRTESNGVLIAGPRHSVTLYSQ